MALLRDIVLLIWITAATGLICDETAIPLPHINLRSRLLIASSAQTLTDDSYLSQAWYSTVSDSDPNKQYVMTNGSVIPDRFSCNAVYSIYLKGDHPVLEDGKDIEAVTCRRTHSEECSDESSVNIRRCKGFYEYELKPTTANAAYCFDREDIENGVAPGSDVVGTPAVEVKLLYESIDEGFGTIHTPRLEFYCNFNIGDLFYLVSWYVNDQLIETIGPHNTDVKDATKLTEKMLTDKGYTLGISIRCSVMAAITLTGERNDPKFSPDFFAGIRILYSESKLTLKKGEVGSIVMENTVPVGCEESQLFNLDCGLSVAMYDPTDDNKCQKTTLSVLGNSKFCSADIKALKYTQLKKCQQDDTCDEQQYTKFDMRVTTRNDAKTEEGYTFILRLQTANTQHKIWKDYFISDVPVDLVKEDWDGGHCYSRTDPHQRTTDGLVYENQQLGRYILYRNEEHNIEVQQTTIPCQTAFCTCDVTIRAEATVFHYSVCNKAVPFIDYLRCDDDALDVRKISDGRYQVHTPIGSMIEIRERRWKRGLYLDLDITMSPKDFKKTDGLCGYFNNNILGDLVKSDGTVSPDNPNRNEATDFASSWAVEKVSKDLRDPDVVTGLQSSLSGEQTLCVCPFIKQRGTTISPLPNTGTDNIALCSTSDFLTCTKPPFNGEPKTCKRFLRRRKRSTDEDRARFRREQFYHRHHLVKKSVDESDGTEGDMQTGQDLCMDYLQAQNDYQTLNTSMPSSEATESFIYTCAADYAILGYMDPELTRGHYEGLKNDIKIEIDRNLIFSKANPELIKTFTDNTCPYDCNEHGTCVKGKCQCTADYGGSACDTKKSDPINVAEVSGGSLCNRELEDCETVLLRASIVHDTVTSKVEVTRVFGDGTPDVTEATSFTCVPDSSYAAECQVPSFRRKRSTISPTPLYIKFTLYLSNDGLTYIGNPGTFIVYSLPCLKSVTLATGESAMEVQDGYCIIDGICRSNSETNSEKSCLSCDSGKNKFVWTDGCDSASKLDLPLIIGLSAAGFLVLCAIAIITGCCLFKKYHDRTRSTTPMVMFEPPGNTHYANHLSDANMLRQHGKKKEDVQHLERGNSKSNIYI